MNENGDEFMVVKKNSSTVTLIYVVPITHPFSDKRFQSQNSPPVKFIIVSISNAAKVEKYMREEQNSPVEGTRRPANSSLLCLSVDERFLFGGGLYFVATLTLTECHRASPVQY